MRRLTSRSRSGGGGRAVGSCSWQHRRPAWRLQRGARPAVVGRIRRSRDSDPRHAEPLYENSHRRLAAVGRHARGAGPAPDARPRRRPCRSHSGCHVRVVRTDGPERQRQRGVRAGDVSITSCRERNDARGVGRRRLSDVHVFAGMGRDAPRRPPLSEPGRSRRRRLGRGAGLQAGRRSAARLLVAVSDELLVHDRRLDEGESPERNVRQRATAGLQPIQRRRGYSPRIRGNDREGSARHEHAPHRSRLDDARVADALVRGQSRTRSPQRDLRRRRRHENIRRERPDRRRRPRPGPVFGARRAWPDLPLHDAGAVRRAHVDARPAVRDHVERASRPPERVRRLRQSARVGRRASDRGMAASSLQGKRRLRADAVDRRDRGVRAVAHRARRGPPAGACARMVARRRPHRSARSSLADRRTAPSSRIRRSCG